jgi:hypothetical protein
MVKKGGTMYILRNRATLYSVFFLSVVYLFFLLLNYDFPAVFFFGLVGLVSSFFTRNMIIVLSISLIVTMILKMGGVLGEPSTPPMTPSSEKTVTTEIVMFDEEGNEKPKKEVIVDVDIKKQKRKGNDIYKADREILELVIKDEPSNEDLLLVPGYQSSIMLSNDSTLTFDKPIEMIPVDMESTYGYEFNNPFSKMGQKCGVSDQYSCFH